MKLTETIADAIIDKLKAGLAARLTTINTEKNDGITVTAPATNDYYPGGPTLLLPVRTLIAVTEAGAEYGEEGPHSLIYTADIGIWILDLDLDRPTLARKLWRQARAITETLWDDAPREALTGSAFTLKPVGTKPGPVFEPSDERTFWSGWYGVLFRCKQLEA